MNKIQKRMIFLENHSLFIFQVCQLLTENDLLNYCSANAFLTAASKAEPFRFRAMILPSASNKNV